MKKISLPKLLLLFSFFLAFSFTSKADHMLGSDISWKCIGKDSFIVTVAVYRDCNGISMPASDFTLTPKTKGCKGYNTAVTISCKMTGGKDITPTCKKSCSRCGKKSNTNYGDQSCKFPYGIEQYFMTARVILPSSKYSSTCCEFEIAWTQCCRSAGITTGGTWGNFWVTATLNRCAKPCNSSPYFTNPPVAIVCKGQCITFNNGVNDDDIDSAGNADSLVFSFTKPMGAAGTPVPYSSPYKYNIPLKFTGFPDATKKWDPPKCEGLHLDSATGDLQFKATKAEITIVGFLVQEYAKDASGKVYKKGETRRDVQLIIMDCKTNHVPTLSGIDGTTLTDADFCVNQFKCFTINSYDEDSKDTVQVSWNKGIPGATFTVETKKQHPKSIFCWKPGPQHVRTYPYSFIVNGVDDACPLNGRVSRSFRVRVHPSPEIQVIDSFKGCGDVVLYAFPKNNSVVSRYVWSLEDADHSYIAYGNRISHHYRKAGTYKWRLDAENPWKCVSSDSGSITIPPYVQVELPNDTAICNSGGSKITITGTYGKGKPFYKLIWSTGDTGTNTITVNVTRDTAIYLQIKDQQPCINADTMHIFARTPPKPKLMDGRSCPNTTVSLQDTNIKYKAIYVWTDANSGGYLGNSSVLSVKDSGQYALKVTDSFGCVGFDTANVFFNPIVNVVPKKYNGCLNDTAYMDGGIGDPNAVWTWKTFDNPPKVIGTGKKLQYPLSTNKNQYFMVTVSQTYKGVTCSDSDTITLTVNPKPSLKIFNFPDLCTSTAPVDLSTYVSNSGGTWSILSPSPAAGVQLNFLYPAKAGIGTHKLQYYYKSPATGCDTTLFTQVTIDDIPKVFAGND
ncbi:MAG: hypothetical protein NTX03_14095, partial [Bacteroidetes bacterium]|nr:hypothetical protein [Bacteroidota bacterium]